MAEGGEARVVAQRVEHRLDLEEDEEGGALFARAGEQFEGERVFAEAEADDGRVVGRDVPLARERLHLFDDGERAAALAREPEDVAEVRLEGEAAAGILRRRPQGLDRLAEPPLLRAREPEVPAREGEAR
jgi:hypothetical protein